MRDAIGEDWAAGLAENRANFLKELFPHARRDFRQPNIVEIGRRMCYPIDKWIALFADSFSFCLSISAEKRKYFARAAPHVRIHGNLWFFYPSPGGEFPDVLFPRCARKGVNDSVLLIRIHPL